MGKIAFVFAGQGAQYVGMGKDLYDRFPAARAVFDAAGEAIRRLCFEGPAEALDTTVHTQPCLFAMDLACARALDAAGVHAEGAAGFSLGEIPALAHCGLLPLEEALELVRLRASAMQRCAEKAPGAMLAVVKLPAERVEAILAELPGAYAANYNAPGQTVVACAQGAAQALSERVAALGGKALRLAVSGAFHCPLMAEAGEALSSFLAGRTFGAMRTPLYANATGDLYGDPRALLSRQVTSPVLWQQTIKRMVADGFDRFIEVGPGKVLSGLIRKIDGNVGVFHAGDVASLESTISEVGHAAG